jgi:SAM-dependent methyltransferase
MAQGDTAFTGSIPQLYDRHLGALMFRPYANDLAQRFQSMATGQLLEIAAGTGIVTAVLASQMPEAVTIVATDLNQAMLNYAAAKAGLDRVRWQQADALELPFETDQFDAVACQFGVMFFRDRVAGFREVRRVLKPAGRFIFNVWDSLSANPVMDAVIAGLARRYPDHPSWFLDRTPCGYRDPAVIRADLDAAGFKNCSIETLILSGHADSPRDPAIGLCQGSPMRGEIEELDPAGLDAATDAAAAALARRFGNGTFDVKMQALVVETIG